jgi:hypothetical protein
MSIGKSKALTTEAQRRGGKAKARKALLLIFSAYPLRLRASAVKPI